jgi:hypothetical protein
LIKTLHHFQIVVPISGALSADGYSLNPFPVVIKDKAVYPWNIHRVNLDRLPFLITPELADLSWLGAHLSLALSDHEREMTAKNDKSDVFLTLKENFHAIFIPFTELEGTLEPRAFTLVDQSDKTDTTLFITSIRFDLSSHTLVADGYVLPVTAEIIGKIASHLKRICESAELIEMLGDEHKAWKQILPAFAERCRQWRHTEKCDYLVKGIVPLSVECYGSPLCRCGRGQDVGEFREVKEWEGLAPYVTRVAIGPLFAVSYVESVTDVTGADKKPVKLRDIATEAHGSGKRCKKCGGAGKPKILLCGSCRKVGYCSSTCQKEDWKTHKIQCKT